MIHHAIEVAKQENITAFAVNPGYAM